MSLRDLRNDHEERTWAERRKEPFFLPENTSEKTVPNLCSSEPRQSMKFKLQHEGERLAIIAIIVVMPSVC